MAIDKKKIAIGFVIYKPEKSFFDRIELIKQSKIPCFIYDNSPENTVSHELMKSMMEATYISSGMNQGLGVGLARLCQSAHYKGFDALLFFDQDTCFNNQSISFIKNYFYKYPDIVDTYSAIVFSGGGYRAPEDVYLAINSGSLFFLKNLEKIGWHNPDYFVDGVDYEFCLRSHIHGFNIKKIFNTPYFDHETEQPDEALTIFGKRLLIRKYSAIRIRDGIRSYFQLIYSSVINWQFKFAYMFCRSFLIYAFGQLLARVLSWGKK